MDQTQSATREFARVFQIISVIHIRTVVQNALWTRIVLEWKRVSIIIAWTHARARVEPVQNVT